MRRGLRGLHPRRGAPPPPPPAPLGSPGGRGGRGRSRGPPPCSQNVVGRAVGTSRGGALHRLGASPARAGGAKPPAKAGRAAAAAAAGAASGGGDTWTSDWTRGALPRPAAPPPDPTAPGGGDGGDDGGASADFDLPSSEKAPPAGLGGVLIASSRQWGITGFL